MNRVDILGYSGWDVAAKWYEAYIDLSQVISMRQLTDADKKYRNVSHLKEDMIHLVVKFELKNEDGLPLQDPVGWVVPGNIHAWAELVREAKRQAKNQ